MSLHFCVFQLVLSASVIKFSVYVEPLTLGNCTPLLQLNTDWLVYCSAHCNGLFGKRITKNSDGQSVRLPRAELDTLSFIYSWFV